MNNCNTEDHPPECLCDVKIVAPTPINYGLTDTWHGEAIARALGLGVPWTGKDVAVFGTALLKAYDIWSRDTRRGERIEGEVLRIKVCDLLRTGESMTDVSRILDIPWQTIIQAMTNGVPATVWSWDEDQWRHAEAVIYDSFTTHGGPQLASMIGAPQGNAVHHCVIDQLAEWYGVTVNENGQARLDTLKRLLRGGLHPIDAVAEAAALGIEASNEQMYHMRKRLAERGEVGSVLPKRLAHA